MMMRELSKGRSSGHDEICSVAQQYASECDANSAFPHKTITCAKQHCLLSPKGNKLGADKHLIFSLGLCYDLGRVCSTSSMVMGMHFASWELINQLEPRHTETRETIKKLHDDQALIASLTTEFGNNGDITKTKSIVEHTDDTYSMVKETPICSYLEEADAVMALSHFFDSDDKKRLGVSVFLSDQLDLTRLWDWDAIGMRGTQSHGFHVKANSTTDPVMSDLSGNALRTVLTPASHLYWVATWFGIFDYVFDMVTELLKNGKEASPAAIGQATHRLDKITKSRDALYAIFEQQIDRYIILRSGGAAFGFRDVIEFNDLKVEVSTQLSHNMLDLMTILGTRHYSDMSGNVVWRKFRDLSSSMFMISNDLINANSATLRRLAEHKSHA